MANIQFNKIYRYFIEEKTKEIEIDSSLNSYEILDIAKQKNKIIKIDKNIFLTLFKTKFEEKDSILMLFVINFDGKINIATLNEVVLGIVGYLEKTFGQMDDMLYFKDEDKKNKKGISFLKVIKKI
mgnify:FL=1